MTETHYSPKLVPLTETFFSLKTILTSCAILFSIAVFGQEICNNGIDDDGDNLIDLNDTDCACSGFGGTANLSSLIPNSSFEDNTCCPNSYSQLNCADTWIQASNPTSDYWNTCGQAGSSFDGLATLPIPDGNGFVGFINMSAWQEYIGACLLAPMLAGEEYELNFWFGHTGNSPPIEFTFFGTPNCSDLPFNGNDCPTGIGGFVNLGSEVLGGGTGWENHTITFTPTMDINALVMGGACGSGGARTYYYLDDLSLESVDEFEVLSLVQNGDYCNDNIVLNATSDTVGGVFQWYREGIALVGETSEVFNVEPGIAGVGTYTVTYVMDNQCEAETVEVVEAVQPTAEFTGIDVCLGDPVNFTDLSAVALGNIISWDWDFDDLTTSADQNPSHVYAASGTYSVELVVTTDLNCSATYTTNVTVHPEPSADFSTVAGCLGVATVFTDESTIAAPGNINSWAWDFGNAATSALQNPTNLYAVTNTYNVELTVTSGDGCSDLVIYPIDVYPSPVLDVSAPVVCQGDNVQFINNSSITAGTIAVWDWDFGDNTSSVLSTPQHTYVQNGPFTVDVIGTSDEGCATTSSFDVVLNPNPVADFTVTEVCSDEPVLITDNSYAVAPGVLTTFAFSPGDLTATQPAVPAQYLYANPGTYTVQLIVSTQHGCEDMQEVETTVYAMPTAAFNFSNICENETAQFVDASTIPAGNITSWEWNFGNNNTSNLQQPPVQTYPADLTYPVSLVVSNGTSCSDTLEDVIEVYPTPIAEFTFDSVCFPLEVQFTDFSNPNGAYPITSWDWTFSDAQTSAVQSPSVDFIVPGIYSADLMVSNGPGCSSSFADGYAVVHSPPIADFPNDLAACLEETIFFTDESSITPVTDDEIIAWQWDFDDTGNSVAQEPSHLYLTDNLYNVQLGVTTNYGCTDVASHLVEIYPLPNVDFATSPVEGCAPLGVQFSDQTTITPPYTLAGWSWNLGSTAMGSMNQNPFYTYNPEMGPLDVAIFDVGLTVTSSNGCVSEILRPDLITVYPKPDALFSVDEYVKDILKPEFIFTDLSSPNVISWDWTFGDGFISTIPNPVHEYAEEGTYPVELIVETNYGCLDTIGTNVKVNPIFTFYIPNSFTPDADDINELFYGQGTGYTSYSMFIYDRWGEELFQSNDDKNHWDGTYNGRQVQQGTYVYRFYLLDWEGHDHEYKGHFSLHR